MCISGYQNSSIVYARLESCYCVADQADDHLFVFQCPGIIFVMHERYCMTPECELFTHSKGGKKTFQQSIKWVVTAHLPTFQIEGYQQRKLKN